MSRARILLVLVAGLAAVALTLLAAQDADLTGSSDPVPAAAPPAQAGQRALPLAFEPNVGQTGGDGEYLSRLGEFRVTLDATGLRLTGATVARTRTAPARTDSGLSLSFVGVDADATATAGAPLPGRVHYVTAERALRDIPTYDTVTYRQIYPGIDARYRGADGNLALDLSVAPGSDLAALALEIGGDERASLVDGRLAVRVGKTEVRLGPPVVLEPEGATASWAPIAGSSWGIGLFDPDRDTPARVRVVFEVADGDLSTWPGLEGAPRLAVAEDGTTLVAGRVSVPESQATLPHGDRARGRSSSQQRAAEDLTALADAFVIRLAPDRRTVLETTHFGGRGSDVPLDLAIDSESRAVVVGRTTSVALPASVDSARSTGDGNAFVAVIDPDGSVAISTILGGSGDDSAYGVALSGDGTIWIAGRTFDSDLTVTADAVLNGPRGGSDGFLVGLDRELTTRYATYLGGAGDDEARDLTIDARGRVIVAGTTRSTDDGSADGFVAAFDPSRNEIAWESRIGGAGDDDAAAIAIDGAGRIVFAGTSRSVDLPLVMPVQPALAASIDGSATDGFVTVLDGESGEVLFSTYLGGTGNERTSDVAVDPAGRAWVVGVTDSADFPVAGVASRTMGGGTDAFVAEIDVVRGELLRATHVGGAAGDAASGLALLPEGGALVAGATRSADLAATRVEHSAVGGDAFLAEVAALPRALGCPGTFNFDNGGGDNQWTTAANWDTNTVPSGATADVCIDGFNVTLNSGTQTIVTLKVQGAGSLTLTGGTLNISGEADIDTALTMTNGSIGGGGPVNVDGLFTWSGFGTLGGNGTPLPTFTANGGTVITTPNTRTINRIFVNPAGKTFSWQDGTLNLGVNGAQFDNAGAFVAEHAGDRQFNGAAANRPFSNLPGATFRKALPSSGTVGITYMDAEYVDQATTTVEAGQLQTRAGGTYTGDFTVDTGALLVFNGGTHNLNAGSSLTAPGDVQVASATVNVSGTADFDVSGDLTLSGGTLGLSNTGTLAIADLLMTNGSLGGTSDVTITGLFHWSGFGTLGGTGNPLPTFTANGGTVIDTPNNRTINRIFVNPVGKTVSWQDGTLNLGANGAQFDNSGVFVAEHAGDRQFNGAVTLRPINNLPGGTFRKALPSAGTVGITYIDTQYVDQATTTVEAGELQLRAGGTYTGDVTVDTGARLVLNGGTYNLNAGSSLTSPGDVIVANGTVNVSGAADFDVSGDLTLSGGTLNLSNTGTLGIADLLMTNGSLGGTSDVTITGLFHWSGFGTLGGTGNPLPTFTPTGGTVIDTPHSRSINRIFVNPAGKTVSWQDGTLNLGANGAQFDNSGVFVAEHAGDRQFNGAVTLRPINNLPGGTFRKALPSVGTVGITYIDTQYVDQATTTVEAGELQLRAGGTYTGDVTVDTGARLVLNGGTYNLNAGSSLTSPGDVIVASGTVNTSGTADVDISGDLTLSGGTLNLSSTGTLGIADLLMTFGNLGGTSPVTITGLFHWSGFGTLGGTGNPLPTFTPTGGTVIDTPHSRSINRIFVNPAGKTVSWQDGTLNLGANGAEFDNSGVFVAEHAGDRQFNGATTLRPINNLPGGTFRKALPSVGTVGITYIDTQYVDQATTTVEAGELQMRTGGTYTGDVTVDTGARLVLSGGTHNLNAGSSLTSPGDVIVASGTVNTSGTADVDISGDLTLSGGTLNLSNAGTLGIADLLMTFGNLGGTSPVTITGLFHWSGFGTLGGTGNPLPTFTADGGTVIDTPHSRSINRIFVNPAGKTVSWQDGTLNLSVDGARVDNSGAFVVEHAGDRQFNGSTTNRPFNNLPGGTFRKALPSAGTVGITYIDTQYVDQATTTVEAGELQLRAGGTYTGDVTVDMGTRLVLNGGTYNLNAGSSLTSPGDVIVANGTVNVSGAADFDVSGDLTLSGGTLNLSNTGTLGIADLLMTFGSLGGTSPVTITGLFHWSGFGTLGGTGNPLPTFTPTGGTVIDTPHSRSINRIFVNPAGKTVSWQDGTLNLSVDGARIDNSGAFVVEHAGDRQFSGAVTLRPINNLPGGTFRKALPSAGTVGITYIDTQFVNQGDVTIEAGALAPRTSYTQTAGTTLLNGGAIAATVSLNIAGGSLKGIGSITAPTVNNNGGQVEPGLSPGVLSIGGDYVQAAGGTYALEIAGLTAGTEHDRLDIVDTGVGTVSDAMLSGTLAISLLNGFNPTIGDTFTILNAESVTGAFSNITTTPPLGCGLAWSATYNPTSAVLEFIATASADLGVSVADAPDPVAVGDTLTYTVVVANNGPEAGDAVVLTDTLPGGVTFSSALATQGGCSHASGTVTCNLGTIAAGASATVTIQVVPDAPGTLTDAATVTATSCDPVPGNDTDSVDTIANDACPDLDSDGHAVCDASCTPFASDQCGDCDDTEPNCSDDCSDNNGNTTPDCAEICPDVDGDGYAACDGVCSLAPGDQCGDCDDTVAAIQPGATEITGDGIDQNCDGVEVCFADGDDDGYRPDSTSVVASTDTDCDDAGEALGTDPTGDCNDAAAAINPGATELAGDGVDQDCDGTEVCFVDADDDGYRPDGTTTVASADVDCVDAGEAVAGDPTGDCDDAAAAINPGATELAGDSIDQDCDGTEVCFVDADDDGFRPDAASTVVSPDTDCADSGEAVAGDPTGDCNDAVAAIHPGATELAGDGIDQDCDGTEVCFVDADDDGYRPDAASTIPSPDTDCDDPGEAVVGDPTGDCNDAVSSIHPGATEACNGIDDDCDNTVPVDENDDDGDGVRICDGDCDDTLPTCAADCSDNNGNMTPDCAEVCPDDDGDGYAICDGVCGLSSGDVCGDCNDTDAAIHPGVAEITGDGIDQDCNGTEVCFADADDDGYRPDAASTVASADTDCNDTGEALAGDPTGDCNDTSAAIHPGATEITGDGVDQDCNGAEVCFIDADDDGYRPDATATTPSADTDCSDAGEALAADPTGDCDDTNATIHPGATELVGDGVDQNCDGTEVCFVDADDDGYRPNATSTVASPDTDCADAGEALAADPTGDCDDTNATIHPGATELAADGVDQDCDGTEVCFVDADNDGYRPNATATVTSTDVDCADSGEAVAGDPTGDCNDANAAVHPGATEIAGDNVDQDCDGTELCFVDADDDGYRPDATSTVLSTDTDCNDPGEALAGDPTTDCNDTVAAINPGVTETGTAACADGLDNDCDGTIDTADATCAAAVMLCGALGDQPTGESIDQDVWTFQGQEGEAVTVQLAASGGDTGHADLVLVDDMGTAVDFFLIDRSDLPNSLTAMLPATGAYRLAVLEHSDALILPGRAFRGDYCVTFDANLGAAQSLAPTSSIETP